MKVKVANRMYSMNQKQYHGLLKIASEQVPYGIYAVEKKGYAELCNERCSSATQLKNKKRAYKIQGFKVLANE